MRVLAIVKASKESEEEGGGPSEEELTQMGKFNDELLDAEVMLAGEGLQPSAKGARIVYDGTQRTVVEGPFETTELAAGFWILKVDTLQDAIAWLEKAPFAKGEVELRPIVEDEDFGAELTPELRAQAKRQREKADENAARV